MKFHPTTTRVLIELPPEDKSDLTKSGIYIPKGAQDKKPPQFGTVKEVGPACSAVQKKDFVLFAEYGFEPIEFEGKKYLIGLEENVLAIIEK